MWVQVCTENVLGYKVCILPVVPGDYTPAVCVPCNSRLQAFSISLSWHVQCPTQIARGWEGGGSIDGHWALCVVGTV